MKPDHTFEIVQMGFDSGKAAFVARQDGRRRRALFSAAQASPDIVITRRSTLY